MVPERLGESLLRRAAESPPPRSAAVGRARVVVAAATAAAAAASFKIAAPLPPTAWRRERLLHWNILDGGGSRLDGIGALSAGGYDVVTLNELNGFSAVVEGVAARLAHSAFLHKSAYTRCSRKPLERVKFGNDEIFAHGRCGTPPACASASPTSTRTTSAAAPTRRAIVARVPPRAPFLLVGDLNTLSPADRALHEGGRPPSSAAARTPRRSARSFDAEEDAVDYALMAALVDGSAALIDVAPPRGSCTVPTAINADKMHFRARLDYALAPLSLARGACAPPARRCSTIRSRTRSPTTLSPSPSPSRMTPQRRAAVEAARLYRVRLAQDFR